MQLVKIMVFFIVEELSLLLRSVDCVRFLYSLATTSTYLPLNFSFPHHLFPRESTYMLPEHC